MTLLETRVQCTSQRHEEISLVCLNDIESQSKEGKRGTCGKDQSFQTGARVTWPGCSQIACGDVEASGRPEV